MTMAILAAVFNIFIGVLETKQESLEIKKLLTANKAGTGQ